jgi:hypothetical protein
MLQMLNMFAGFRGVERESFWFVKGFGVGLILNSAKSQMERPRRKLAAKLEGIRLAVDDFSSVKFLAAPSTFPVCKNVYLHIEIAAVPVQLSSDVGVFPIQEKKVIYSILEVAEIDLINKSVIAIVKLILRTGKEDLAIGLAQRVFVILLSLRKTISREKVETYREVIPRIKKIDQNSEYELRACRRRS